MYNQLRQVYLTVVLALLVIASLACNLTVSVDQGVPTTTHAVPTTQTVPVIQSVRVTIYANQDWQDTGISVAAGEQVNITYISGLWTFDRNIPRTDTTGQPNYRNDTAPLPNANLGALVARIDNSSPFLVGLQVSTIADRQGNVLLRINDTTDIRDNEGSVLVEITLLK